MNKMIPVFLVLLLAVITFFIYEWSQKGRYSFLVERGALAFLVDSKTGRVEMFTMIPNSGLSFEHCQTIEVDKESVLDIFNKRKKTDDLFDQIEKEDKISAERFLNRKE